MKVIIDFDPGVDDLYAFLFAMLYTKLDILCLTTVNGNVQMEQTFVNAHLIYNKVFPGQKMPPIYAGGKDPIIFNILSDFYNGPDGLAGITETLYKKDVDDIRKEFLTPANTDRNHASLKIIELVNQYPNEISIIALGPLTNLALALRMTDASFTSKIVKIFIMGGSEPHGFSQFSIITQFNYPEFNFAMDPIAAKLVLDIFLCPKLIFTFDFTRRSFFVNINELKAEFSKHYKDQRLNFMEALALLNFGQVGDEKTNNFFLADLSAMIGILDGGKFSLQKRKCNCTVETKDSTKAGLIIEDSKLLDSNIELAIIMDHVKAKNKFFGFMEKLAKL